MNNNGNSQVFQLFQIHVSTNCDGAANFGEKLRRERYETNEVIYGETGSFQRDLLLTKFYNKGIRSSLASCTIIDEVDNMCIDNICNTLYISHSIGDLKFVKELYLHIWAAVNMKDCDTYSEESVRMVEQYINKQIEQSIIVFPSHLPT